MEEQDVFGRRYRAWIDRLELPTEQAEQAWERIAQRLFSAPYPENERKGQNSDG